MLRSLTKLFLKHEKDMQEMKPFQSSVLNKPKVQNKYVTDRQTDKERRLKILQVCKDVGSFSFPTTEEFCRK